MSTKDGFYRLTSERASGKTVAQCIKGEWYCLNEAGPVSLEEFTRRGWTIHSRIRGMRV